MSENIPDSLDRARLLIGQPGMDRVSSARIIIFGVGGVGSWCTEALVRTGIRHITIVDPDLVCPSNINRQMMATTATVGQVKVEALKERLLQINPDAEIEARQEKFTEQTAPDFRLEDYDFIIDCIDSLSDKAALIERATATEAQFYSSMGAALKLDPTKVQVSEFWKVKGCPLARALRQRFKKLKIYPHRKFRCVFSEELLKNKSESAERANGSLMHITAIFGLTIAGLVIQDLYK